MTVETKTVTAWISREMFDRLGKKDSYGDLIGFDDLCGQKGRVQDWCEVDWPPLKLKITVEVVG